MSRNKKITIILFVIAFLLIGAWLSLDSRTKNSLYRATLCKLIYGKNICNFYEMMDIMAYDHPNDADFNKAMQLCREMEDVPKKDGCFEYVAEVISFWDFEKAKQACDEIVGYGLVHYKDRCYQKIQISREEEVAESAVVAFMEARIQRDQELALSWLTDNAGGQYLSRSDLPLTGLSNPHFSDFEILDREKLDNTQFKFKVRIYEEYIGQGRVGYFEETLIVIKDKEKYLIDSFERGQYTEINNSFKVIERVPEGTESGFVQEDKVVQGPLGKISVTFSRNIDENTLTKETFYALRGIGEKVPGTIEYNKETGTASLIFEQEIEGGEIGRETRITVIVEGIRDLEGNQIESLLYNIDIIQDDQK